MNFDFKTSDLEFEDSKSSIWKRTTPCDKSVYFFHYYLATMITDWAQIFTGWLFCCFGCLHLESQILKYKHLHIGKRFANVKWSLEILKRGIISMIVEKNHSFSDRASFTLIEGFLLSWQDKVCIRASFTSSESFNYIRHWLRCLL